MTTQEAIQKAVDVGYQVHGVGEAFLDPLFWQTLGVALEWHVECHPRYIPYNQWWRQPWHRFIDHLAEGKSPESFFKDLCPRNRRSMTSSMAEVEVLAAQMAPA